MHILWTKFLSSCKTSMQFNWIKIEMQKIEEKWKKSSCMNRFLSKIMFVLRGNNKINKRPVIPNKSVLYGKFIQNHLPSRDAYSVRRLSKYSYLPNKHAWRNKRAWWNFFLIWIIAHGGNDPYNQVGWKITAEN